MLKAILFDMDGTVTKPYIDWKALRAEIGGPPQEMIIHYINTLAGEAKQRAEEILVRREDEAAAHSELNEGLRGLLSYLRENRLSTALVTNNSRSSVDVVLRRHHLAFDLILTREDGQTKPSGDLILKALARMRLEPDEALLIGDGKLDMLASHQAGVRAVYLSHGAPDFEHHPTLHSLTEVIGLLESLRLGGEPDSR